GHDVAYVKKDYVSRYQLRHVDLVESAISVDDGTVADARMQPLDRALRAVLVYESEAHGERDDGQDDQRVDSLTHDQAGQSGCDEEQQQRVFNLTQQHSPGTGAVAEHGIRSYHLQPASRLGGSQTGRCGSKPRQSFVDREACNIGEVGGLKHELVRVAGGGEPLGWGRPAQRSEEHTAEIQSLTKLRCPP